MLEQRSLSGWPARGTSGLRARYAPPLGINSSPAIHRASPCRAIHRPAAAASTLRSRLVATRATGNWPAPFSAHSPRKTTWPWLTRWPSTSDSWGRPALSHRSAGVAPHRRLRRTAGCSSRSRSGMACSRSLEMYEGVCDHIRAHKRTGRLLPVHPYPREHDFPSASSRDVETCSSPQPAVMTVRRPKA